MLQLRKVLTCRWESTAVWVLGTGITRVPTVKYDHNMLFTMTLLQYCNMLCVVEYIDFSMQVTFSTVLAHLMRQWARRTIQLTEKPVDFITVVNKKLSLNLYELLFMPCNKYEASKNTPWMYKRESLACEIKHSWVKLKSWNSNTDRYVIGATGLYKNHI